MQNINVVAESRDRPNPIKAVSDSFRICLCALTIQFDDAGLHPVMLENIRLCNYQAPTPIQCYSIPATLTGHDLIAVAQTGELQLSC